LFVTVFILKYFFNLKPKFIIPFSKISFWNVIDRFLFWIVFVLILILPLQIQFLSWKTLIQEKVVPLQILFDVSLSMAADDIDPSRFDAAKSAVMSLLNEMKWYYISLIAFSGAPFVYIPFSSDQKSLSYKLENTTFADFPPDPDFVGTAIGDALILAIDNLSKLDFLDPAGVIILITDGDSNMWYDPKDVLPFLQKKNIPVFVLWVWEQNYLIGYDYFDTAIKTSINVPLLELLAKETGGKFYRVLWKSDFSIVFDEIFDLLHKQEKELVVDEYFNLNDILFVMLIVLWFFLCILRLYFYISHKR